jgi:hypothetical protein
LILSIIKGPRSYPSKNLWEEKKDALERVLGKSEIEWV